MKDFYKNKRILVTGHTGFKGGWLCEILSLWGADICGYSLDAEGDDNFFNTLNIAGKCKSVIGDLRDYSILQKTLIDYKPDIIFHLAAQPIVRTSYQIPVDTFMVNAIGTANLLQAVRSLDKRCEVVLITTDKVYKNLENGRAYKEDDPLGGYDPYSASKAASEIVIESFRLSFFNPSKFAEHGKSLVSVRAGNVIGGGDWAKDRLIPDMVRAMQTGKTTVLRNPLSVRPWQHVLEPLSGYLLAGKMQYEVPLGFSDAFNFGPNPQDVLTVEEVAKIAKIPYEVVPQLGAPHEAALLQLDISKACKELSWTPCWTTAQAIEKTFEWYRTYYSERADIENLTHKQIEEYFIK